MDNQTIGGADPSKGWVHTLTDNLRALLTQQLGRADWGEIVTLARADDIDQALTAYREAREWDPELEISSKIQNELCWNGSLAGRAADVLPHCERAVAAVPDDAHFKDSRGLARALTGDLAGAAEDFRAFVDWAESLLEQGKLYISGGAYHTADDPNLARPFVTKADATTGKQNVLPFGTLKKNEWSSAPRKCGAAPDNVVIYSADTDHDDETEYLQSDRSGWYRVSRPIGDGSGMVRRRSGSMGRCDVFRDRGGGASPRTSRPP